MVLENAGSIFLETRSMKWQCIVKLRSGTLTLVNSKFRLSALSCTVLTYITRPDLHLQVSLLHVSYNFQGLFRSYRMTALTKSSYTSLFTIEKFEVMSACLSAWMKIVNRISIRDYLYKFDLSLGIMQNCYVTYGEKFSFHEKAHFCSTCTRSSKIVISLYSLMWNLKTF